jgi:hypothetical protein
MIYKVLGALIIIASAILAYLTFQDKVLSPEDSSSCLQLTPAQQMAKMIGDDFANLEKEGHLHKGWQSIATLEVRMNSKLAKAILGKTSFPIQRIKDGKNLLELDFLDLEDDENPGVIIQASLFDIKSKNKIYEIGRTYLMSDLNKIPPKEKTKQEAH